MKLKFNFLLILTCIAFTSCTNDNVSEEDMSKYDLDTSTTMQRINPSNYEHIISYDGYSAGASNKGTIDLFLNDKLYNQIEYVGELGYTTVEFTDKFRIINEKDSDEYYDILNVKKTKIDESTELIKFDVKSFDGTQWYGFEYQAERLACPWCWVGAAILTALDSILDATSPSDCQTAIDACISAGGKPSTQIEDGWFSYSCTVICN